MARLGLLTEALQAAERKSAVSAEYEFNGFGFLFEGFIPGLVFLDLTHSELQELAASLRVDCRHHPEELMVIFDASGEPRLMAIYGQRERWDEGFLSRERRHLGDTDFLYILRVYPEDERIWVEGTTDLHRLEERGGLGFELHEPSLEKVKITQEPSGDLILKSIWIG